MSRICGVELRASEAVFAVLDQDGSDVQFIDVEPRKIKLEDDESSVCIKSFYDSIVHFSKENQIDRFVIKKRAKKGQMAGGAISFKLEALIQLNGSVEVSFASGQGIAAAHKKDPFETPEGIKKYQVKAFMAASLWIRKN